MTQTEPLAKGITMRALGQTWLRCPFSWGIDHLITIESSAGRLVLCEMFEQLDGDEPGKVTARPIYASTLDEWEGSRPIKS